MTDTLKLHWSAMATDCLPAGVPPYVWAICGQTVGYVEASLNGYAWKVILPVGIIATGAMDTTGTAPTELAACLAAEKAMGIV